MFNKKLMILAIFFVSLLTVSVVSAADNATDDVVSADETNGETVDVSDGQSNDLIEIDDENEIVDKNMENNIEINENQDSADANAVTAEADNEKIESDVISSSNEEILNAQDNGTFTALQEKSNNASEDVQVLSDTSQNTLSNNVKSNGNKIGEEVYSFIEPTFKISVPKEVYKNSRVTIKFTCSDKVNGKISLDLDNGEINDIEIKKGKGSAKIKIPFVKSIDYQFFSYDETVGSITGSFKINVKPAVVIKASNFKVNYPSKTKYKVRILTKKGVSIGAGKKVTFTLYDYGEKIATKTVKTDKKGYAKVYFNVAPSYYKFNHYFNKHSYKVKIKCISTSVTKKYTVKAAKIYVKKFTKNKRLYKDYDGYLSGFNKKLSISFVLKTANGKYLKGQTVKFKFKGKTYSAKSNRKGIVTFPLKRSNIKTELQGDGENHFKIYYKKQIMEGHFSYFTKKMYGGNKNWPFPYKHYIYTYDLVPII